MPSAWDAPTADVVPVPSRLSQLSLRKRIVSFRQGGDEGDGVATLCAVQCLSSRLQWFPCLLPLNLLCI